VEDAIRGYLESLTSKASTARSVVDREAVQALRDQLKQATDPIARLDLARELRAASTPKAVEPKPHPGLEVFVANARAWAEEHGYTAGDLQRYAKVPADVLREAGFHVPAQVRRASSVVRTRAARLDPRADVLPAVKALGGTFKLSDLAQRIDRDVATTRNYLRRLVADGLVTEAGEDASGQGRPAKLYKPS
jgi:hypothetical protein